MSEGFVIFELPCAPDNRPFDGHAEKGLHSYTKIYIMECV
jgi:hypothetical protein